jgi:tRNA (guanine37-N1)-methyltransferase
VSTLAVRVVREEGESTRKRLLSLGLLDNSRRVGREGRFLLIPVLSGEGLDRLELVDVELEEQDVAENDYRNICRVPESLRARLPSSYDIIGDVAIIKLDDELLPFAPAVGESMVTVHPRLRCVALDRGVKGEFRVRDLDIVAGNGPLETVHQEFGLRFKVDPSRTYFNPRLANERHRIAGLVRKGEVVIDMFAGVGPFSIMIAKLASPEVVFAIDINPDAEAMMNENIVINRVERMVPLLGDARELIFDLPCADRLVMNLPHTAVGFFADALTRLNLGGTMHLYHIADRGSVASEVERLTTDSLGMGVRTEVLRVQELKTYSPTASVYSIDLWLAGWA